MAEMLLNGVRYGVTGAVAVGTFVAGCIVLTPIVLLLARIVNLFLGNKDGDDCE